MELWVRVETLLSSLLLRGPHYIDFWSGSTSEPLIWPKWLFMSAWIGILALRVCSYAQLVDTCILCVSSPFSTSYIQGQVLRITGGHLVTRYVDYVPVDLGAYFTKLPAASRSPKNSNCLTTEVSYYCKERPSKKSILWLPCKPCDQLNADQGIVGRYHP